MSEADINACPYLENIRIVTRRVYFKVLGYSRHAIWTLKSAKKVITENSSATPRSFCGREVSSSLTVNNCQADLRSASASFA